MTVTREMIGAAHDICLSKGDFVLSASLLERIYLAMRERDETFDNGPMGEEVNDILRAKLAELERVVRLANAALLVEAEEHASISEGTIPDLMADALAAIKESGVDHG